MKTNKIYNGDCLKVMRNIDSKSINMILCDLPYGTTACKWDSVIDLKILWKQYNRVIKDNGCIVLTGKEPFSSTLRLSNAQHYRYDWKWVKSRPSRYVQAKRMPLSYYEDILVFYKNLPVYNPQMTKGTPYIKRHKNTTKPIYHGEEKRNGTLSINNGVRFPSDVLFIPNPNKNSIHPTQKPVELFEYLIKTYTNKNDVVLDNCSGSGTTALACANTGRRFICIEKDFDYYNASLNMIKDKI